MDIKPKSFVAVCDFSHGADHFAAGDVVPHGRTLRALLQFGDQFVTEAPRGKAAQGKESADG